LESLAIEFVLVFLLSLFFIWLVRHFAERLGLVDIPNERSSHTNSTPRGAGIGFFLAVAVVTPFFHYTLISNYSWVILAIMVVFAVGVLDDHRDTKPNTKLFVMAISTLLIYSDKLYITHLGNFFGIECALGWFALPFTLFAVVAFTNALNLIDGLDGLAGGISVVILASFFYIGYMHNDEFIIVLSGSFLVGLLAFLLFNWHPASIFMGDSGSLMLGFVITAVAIKSLEYVPAIAIFFLAALPIIDTLVTVVRRKLNGGHIFAPDRCHLHHVMLEFFAGDVRKTALFFIVMQSVYSLTGLQFSKNHDEGMLLLLFVLNIVLIYFYIMAMIRRQQRECGAPK